MCRACDGVVLPLVIIIFIYIFTTMGWVYDASPEVVAQSKYPTIIAVCVVLTTLMVMTVLARIWIRVQQGRTGPDDYIVFFGMIFSIVYNILCIIQTRYGLGLPLALRPTASLDTYTKVNFAGRPFYQLGIAGFKAALCISCLRLLSGTTKAWYRGVIWAVGIISTVGHVAGTLVLLLSCSPVRKSWDPRVKGTCLPPGPTFYGLAAFTIVCDVTIILLPIPVLMGLHVRPAQKAGVVCLFLLGLFTTVCSILRMAQISVINYNGDSTMLVLWGTIEFNVGNIVTSLPFLAPMLKRWISDFGYQLGYKKSTLRSGYILQPFSKGSIKSSTTRSNVTTTRHSHVPMLMPVSMSRVSRTPSQECILDARELNQPPPAVVNGGITRTMEYHVTVDDGSDPACKEPHAL
ncbi:hypothetical protein VTN77DRAFT_4699 [Rasamsonia byssochlamydoides]|uniref:uncharacterized protein n=1 Tax=Rasamsonia byssochlamydoides TaxID=89139 RepID=UPI003744371E